MYDLFHNEVMNIFLFQFVTIAIINGCNSIEQIHDDILTECIGLHVKIKLHSIRDDLLSIERYIRNMPPVFTAVGFFRINRGLYSTFCSVLVTYFVIIIQFNSVSISNSASSGVIHRNLTNKTD